MTYHFSYPFEISYNEISKLTHKQKKQKSTMKERYQIIDFPRLHAIPEDFDNPNVEIGESATIIVSDEEGIQLIDHDTGEIQKINTPITTFYKRSSGKDKILNQIISSHTDPNQTLLAFDMIFAVDTNTINNTSVTAIAQMCFAEETNGIIDVTCKVWDSTEAIKPEVHAWAVVASTIYTQHLNKEPNKKVAIIVDSELGILQQCNERKKPLVQDFYLPPNFTLIYASADTGMEFIANHLIKICDKCAGEVLNSI